MSERVFTIAVWDVGRRRWSAFATSPDHELIKRLAHQLVSFVMVFCEIVEVPGSDDDAVEAALAMLPKVHPEAVFQSYFDLVEFVSLDQPGDVFGGIRPVRH